MVGNAVQDIVVEHEIIMAREKNTTADVLRRGVGQCLVPRYDFRELAYGKIVKRARENILSDGAKLTILKNTEVGAEVRVSVIAIANILLPVETVGLARCEKVDDAASALGGASPAVVWAFVDLLKVNGELIGSTDTGAQHDAVSSVFAAAQLRPGAAVVGRSVDGVPWIEGADTNFHVLIGGARGPHGVLGGERRITLQTGSEIPERTWRKPALGMRTLRRIHAARAFAETEDAPGMAFLRQPRKDLHGRGGFSVEGSGKRIDEPFAKVGELRREKTLGSVILTQQKTCLDRGTQKGKNVGAQVFGPSTAVGVPLFHRWSCVVAGIQGHALLPHVCPDGSHRVFGEKKRH